MLFFIGIYDTDNPTSADSKELALRLGEILKGNNEQRLLSITSHALIRHPDISCTAKNHAACLVVDSPSEGRRDLELICREFLLRESAPGSNAGFALAPWDLVNGSIIAWGHLATSEILTRGKAIELAKELGISIAGFTGTGVGVIGALAALGLRYEGNDGWFTWLPGLNELRGVMTTSAIFDRARIERVETTRGKQVGFKETINLGAGVNPLLRNSKSVLRVRLSKEGEPFDWVALDAD